MTHKAQVGGISHGTLRNEDLINTFVAEIEHLDAKAYGELLVNVTDFDSEDATNVVCELIDALNELAPPYCYFGANEGDGSDFGFWPCMERIDELPRIADPSEHPNNLAYELETARLRRDWDEMRELITKLAACDFIGEDCAFVNYHGNVTIYDAQGEVIIDFV